MIYKIQEIDGIERTSGIRLREVGIVTTQDLLARCGEATGRRTVACASGLTEDKLLKWANMADLMRISGIGQDYAELLLAAGVATVRDLANFEPAALVGKLRDVNRQKRFTRGVPSLNLVKKWIDQATLLDPIVSS